MKCNIGCAERGIRIAVGICCGHMLGEKMLSEEDDSDKKWFKDRNNER